MIPRTSPRVEGRWSLPPSKYGFESYLHICQQLEINRFESTRTFEALKQRFVRVSHLNSEQPFKIQ